ncbi:MAG: putative quinol monooxygenase [Phycisphaerales bacterium]
MSAHDDTTIPPPASSRPTVRIVVRVRAKPDLAERMGALLASIVEPTRAEPACVSYELLQDRETPFEFLLVQEWRSDRAYDEHLEQPHMLAVYERIDPMLDGLPEIRRCSLVK